MTRQLHAAVPTSETPGCRLQRQNIQMRDLCHPLNFCGAHVSLLPKASKFVLQEIATLKLGSSGEGSISLGSASAGRGSPCGVADVLFGLIVSSPSSRS